LHDVRTGNFAKDSPKRVLEILRIVDFADTFATAAFGGLDHDREANDLSSLESLFPSIHTGFSVGIFRHSHVAFGRHDSI
jgi:hypothetical protein